MPGDGTQEGTPVLPLLPTVGKSSDLSVAATPKQLSEADVNGLVEKELARREKQSRRDQANNQRAKLLSGIDPVEAEAAIAAAGGNVKQGLRNMALDRLLAPTAVEESEDEAPTPIRGKVDEPAPDRTGLQKTVVSLLNDAGIAPDDADYLALTQKIYPTEGAFISDVASLAVKRARGAAPASAGAGAAASGGGIPGNADADAKLGTLQKRLGELMKSPAANAIAIRDVRAELAALV